MRQLEIVEKRADEQKVYVTNVPVGSFFRIANDGLHFQRTSMGYSCVNTGEHFPITLDDEWLEVQLAKAVKLEVIYE